MKVAVLMSTYNGEKYIREQIDSILNQTGDFSLDLWVRDDGSIDSTKTVLEDYAKDGKLQWYTGDNLRSAKSFMDLVKSCKGYDYYAFADQDDYWMPEKISRAVAALKNKKGMNLYFANVELVDSELNTLGRNVYKQSPKLDFETLSCAGGILGCTIVFNKELAEAIQKRPLPEKMVMHDFYIDELCLALGGEITFDINAYMKYRQHQNNVIGVPFGFLRTIKGRIKDTTKKAQISISEQADEILKLYRNEISSDKQKWLLKIAEYKKNFISRISLATSNKTKYINRNMGFKLRFSIFLGNR